MIRLTTFGGQPPTRTWHYDFDSEPKSWQWVPQNSNVRPVTGFIVQLLSGDYTYTGFPISSFLGSALRVGIGLNVFCIPLYQTFTGIVPLPPELLLAPQTHPEVDDPVTLFIPLIGANDLPLSQVALEDVTLTITRPDGSFYLVPGPSPFVFFTPLFASYYMVYQTATGEMNERGWWQITFNAGQAAPGGYVFYIGPPFPEYPVQISTGTPTVTFTTEDGSETYVTEDGTEPYVTEGSEDDD